MPGPPHPPGATWQLQTSAGKLLSVKFAGGDSLATPPRSLTIPYRFPSDPLAIPTGGDAASEAAAREAAGGDAASEAAARRPLPNLTFQMPRAVYQAKAKAKAASGSRAKQPNLLIQPVPAPPTAVATPAAGVVQAVRAVGDRIRNLREKLEAGGLSDRQIYGHPGVKELVAELDGLRAGMVPTAAVQEAAAPSDS